MLPAAASLAGLTGAGNRSRRETEQLPQQRLKKHHQKVCPRKGARRSPSSSGVPGGPLPFPGEVTWVFLQGCIWEELGIMPSL